MRAKLWKCVLLIVKGLASVACGVTPNGKCNFNVPKERMGQWHISQKGCYPLVGGKSGDMCAHREGPAGKLKKRKLTRA